MRCHWAGHPNRPCPVTDCVRRGAYVEKLQKFGLGQADYGGDWAGAAAQGTQSITEAIAAGFAARAAGRSRSAVAEAWSAAFTRAVPWLALAAIGIAGVAFLSRRSP